MLYPPRPTTAAQKDFYEDLKTLVTIHSERCDVIELVAVMCQISGVISVTNETPINWPMMMGQNFGSGVIEGMKVDIGGKPN